MTRHRQFASTAEGKTVYRGYDRLATALQPAKHKLARQGARPPARDTLFGQLANVCSGHEGLGTGTGQDNSPNCCVGFDPCDRVRQLGDYNCVQCVELVWTVYG